MFGSNLAGRHGRGAALHARLYHGAVPGQGEGLHGESYAIPTKDANIRTLPLKDVKENILKFVRYTQAHPNVPFFVTRVGCGLAGFRDETIAPLFQGVSINTYLPQEWAEYMEGRYRCWVSPCCKYGRVA